MVKVKKKKSKDEQKLAEAQTVLKFTSNLIIMQHHTEDFFFSIKSLVAIGPIFIKKLGVGISYFGAVLTYADLLPDCVQFTLPFFHFTPTSRQGMFPLPRLRSSNTGS